MLTLSVTDPDISRGAIQISWCLSSSVVDALANKRVEEPMMLIVTSPADGNYHSRHEERRLVPLRDGLAFVGFRRDGPSKIHAAVVWEDPDDDKSLEDYLLSKKNDDWVNTILKSDGSRILAGEDFITDKWKLDGPIISNSSTGVHVPQGCFAKEPHPLLADWVNWMWSDPPVDTCQFYHRCGPAFTVQIPIFALFYALRVLIALVLTLMTARGLNYQPLLHPLRDNTNDIWAQQKGYYLDLKVPKYKWYSSLGWLPMLASPMSLLISFGICTMFMTGTDHQFVWWIAMLWTLEVTAGLMVFIGALSLITKVALPHASTAWQNYKNRTPDAPPWYQRKDGREFITCTEGGDCEGEARPRGSRALPKFSLKPGVIRLYVQDHKASSCKPYAR